MTADDILKEARRCIGSPFKHQARIPGLGLDCAGLIVSVAIAIDAKYIDRPGYSRNPSGGLLESALDDQPCLERVTDRQPGDVLLMRFAGEPQHLAICAGDTVIHSYEAVGKVCEHDLTDAWVRRIVAVYRFKGLA